ncbi:hypothetical protein E4T49_00673 [Aureobasidium sp. EXF-10728]|nr:hypothetical protein E4T49_00673 [Aureobasidium sp. EXF-10728]
MAEDTTDSGPPPTVDSHVFRLMDLPNELIRKIANDDEFEIKDLKALRLTSKHICHYVTDQFARKCFRKITVLMSRSSLLAFCELSHHPFFGLVVETINISPMFILRQGITSLQPPTPHEIARGHTAYRHRPLQHLEITMNGICEEQDMKTSGMAGRMLAIAFMAFAGRGQRISLQFRDNEKCAIGAGQLLYDKCYGNHVFWHLDWYTTIETTIKAVSNQGCKINGLLFSENSRDDAVNNSCLSTDSFAQDLKVVCSQLKELEIRFEYEEFEATIRSVKRMVSAARNLEVLHLFALNHYGFRYEQLLHLREILPCVTSPSLHRIDLRCFQMSESELYTFLGRYSDTLEELKLSDVCIFKENCISLVAWIKANLPGLTHFCLEEFCIHNPQTSDCDVDEYRDGYLVDYGEDMQARLADILYRETVIANRVEEIEEEA